MSTLNPPRHISKRHELREDQVVTAYAKAWGYFDKHKKLVFGVLGAVVGVVLLGLLWMWWQYRQAGEAQERLGDIVSVYEAGRYREALDGVEGQMGLLAIADEYGSSDAGNLAHFYAADALFNLGEYDQALEHFEDFDAEENLIGASAIAGQAAVYETKQDFARAAALFAEAAAHFENDLTSPGYLLDAARNYEQAGNLEAAREAYEQIQADFKDTQQAAVVDLHLARLEAMTAAK